MFVITRGHPFFPGDFCFRLRMAVMKLTGSLTFSGSFRTSRPASHMQSIITCSSQRLRHPNFLQTTPWTTTHFEALYLKRWLIYILIFHGKVITPCNQYVHYFMSGDWYPPVWLLKFHACWLICPIRAGEFHILYAVHIPTFASSLHIWRQSPYSHSKSTFVIMNSSLSIACSHEIRLHWIHFV